VKKGGQPKTQSAPVGVFGTTEGDKRGRGPLGTKRKSLPLNRIKGGKDKERRNTSLHGKGGEGKAGHAPDHKTFTVFQTRGPRKETTQFKTKTKKKKKKNMAWCKGTERKRGG